MTPTAVLALSLFVGVALGALGGGGSILMVPILVYVAGLDAKEAIATSLLVVSVTAAFAAITHARQGQIRWRTGLLFGLGGMVGGLGGGLLGGHIPGRMLMIGFAVMMLATAIAMLRNSGGDGCSERTGDLQLFRALIDGCVVGLVTGLVGAGGGFLVVPALVLFGGLSMSAAVGTSLLVITMKSVAAFGGYLASVSIDWALAGGISVTAILGSLFGGWLSSRVPEARLKSVFGWFVLATGCFVLTEQAAPTLLWLLAILLLSGVGVVTIVCRGHSRSQRSRQRSRFNDVNPPQQRIALRRRP